MILKVLSLTGQSQAPSATAVEWPWHVSTKYYDADVILRVSPFSSPPSWPSDADAVVLVEPSPADLSPWTAALSSEFAQRPSVLLVAVHAGESYELARSWSLENAAEFVDLDAESVGREKEGVDRIVEALEMNEWEGMRRKQQEAKKSAEEQQQREQPAPGEEKKKLEEETALIEGAIAASFGKGEDEDIDFEAALGKLKTLRDKAQKMPDAQRRELALRVAMAFAKELGDDGGDDGGGGGDGEFGVDCGMMEEDEALAREVFAKLRVDPKKPEPETAAPAATSASPVTEQAPPTTVQAPPASSSVGKQKKSKKGKKRGGK